MLSKVENNLKLYTPDTTNTSLVPLFMSEISCGFPNAANDYIEQVLDLNKYVVKNPESTFFAKVVGLSMIEEGVMPGDIVVIDKSIQHYDNKMCLCWYDDGFTLKYIEKIQGKFFMVPKNKNFSKIEIKEGTNFGIWGVVTFYFRKM